VSAASNQSDSRRRPRHAWLYALRGGRLPSAVCCDGQRYEHVETFKHDFFAATGLYRGPAGELAVLKLGRENEIATIPADWLGRWLTRREVRLYRLLADVPGVPRLIGTVGDNGLLHEYVPGRPLRREDRVDDHFFDRLLELLETLWSRDVAYVDLNKRENVLLGDDGRPYLIDFQISLHLPRDDWGRWRLLRWLLARFQAADRYHALKHKRKLRPDLLSESERRELANLSIWIKLHRWLTRPITRMRRTVLARLHRSETNRVAGWSAK